MSLSLELTSGFFQAFLVLIPLGEFPGSSNITFGLVFGEGPVQPVSPSIPVKLKSGLQLQILCTISVTGTFGV